MPIIDRTDASEVEQRIQRIFGPSTAQHAKATRRLLVEKLDFRPASGLVDLSRAAKGLELPQSAERIAAMDSLNVVYVLLNIPGTDRARKAEAA
ncbi:MAG: hypothetical protein HYY01_02655 [Chloroflexi bacterium]|nr:hypothetical protein [Chloroflexota bacterium]